MPTQYFIITRFNVPLHWPPDHRTPEGWLERRFQLFDEFCFPSVSGQEDKRFTWLVLFDESTTQPHAARIQSYQRRCPMFRPVFMGPDPRNEERAFLVSRRYAEALQPFLEGNTDCVVTTRLDSDDALHKTFMGRLRQHATTQDLEVFNFPVGYYVHAHSNATFRVFDDRGTNTISFLERRRPGEDVRTVYIFDRHSEAAEHRKVNQIDGLPGWITVSHDRTIMNDIRWARGLGGTRMTYPEAEFVEGFNLKPRKPVSVGGVRNSTRDILVVTPVPTHPQDYGNRKRIYRVCRELQKLNGRIHLLHYPAEHRWWDKIPLAANQAMQRQWDSYYLVHPSRPRHQHAVGKDHMIDEWWDESIGEYLDWLTGVQAFDMAIVHYAWMSRAFEHLPSKVFKVLDTHDRVSGRREVLAEVGIEPEFFHTTPEQEAIALRRADLVLGIKDQETESFRQLCDVPSQTLVHWDPPQDPCALPSGSGCAMLTVGFIGAHNSFNRVALEAFLDAALPRFEEARGIRMLVAGTITDYFGDRIDPALELLPLAGDVRPFYEKVDLVVVPMTQSTGFKIKAAEALSYGRPVVASAHAMEGIPTDVAYHLCPDMEAVIGKCLEVARRPDMLPEMAAASRRVHERLRAVFDWQLRAILSNDRPRIALMVLSERAGVLALERQREIISMLTIWWRLVLFVHGEGVRNHDALPEKEGLTAIYDSTVTPPDGRIDVEVMSWEQLQRCAYPTVTWVDARSQLYPVAGVRVVDAHWGEKTAGGRTASPADGDTITLASTHAEGPPADDGLPVMFFFRPPRVDLWQSRSGGFTIGLFSGRDPELHPLCEQLAASIPPRDCGLRLFLPRGESVACAESTCIEVDPVTGDMAAFPERPDIVIDLAGGDHPCFGPLREYTAWSKIPVLAFGRPARIWRDGVVERFDRTAAGTAALCARVNELLDSSTGRSAAGKATFRTLKGFIEGNSRLRQLRLGFQARREAEG